MENLCDTNRPPQIGIYDRKHRGDPGQIFKAYRMGKLLTMAGLRVRNPEASSARRRPRHAGRLHESSPSPRR